MSEKEYVLYLRDELLRARDENIFLADEKLLMQMINIKFIITYDNSQFYNLGTTYAITKKNQSKTDLKYLLSLLNSKLIEFYYLKKFTNESSLTNAISTQNLFKIPIKNIPIESQQPFIIKADQMLSLNKELQEVNEKFQRTLQREFSIEKLSKKLENWHKLPFSDFLNELKKQKVELSLSQKADWEDFLTEQQKAIAIQTKIQETDAKIDKMVYELYGLTEEEIAIVENA